jgi:hypothetical protein
MGKLHSELSESKINEINTKVITGIFDAETYARVMLRNFEVYVKSLKEGKVVKVNFRLKE